MQKFYIDENNNYIGSFDGPEPPKGSIEVDTPPDDGRQKWSGTGWYPLVRPYKEARALEYPDIGDQLDAILKGFSSLRGGGQTLPPETDDLINTWEVIKLKYPKQ